MVTAACIEEGGIVVEAPSARQAVAQVKRSLEEADHENGNTWRSAHAWVRDQAVQFSHGPLDDREAFEYELGWTLASAFARVLLTQWRGEPVNPISRQEALRIVTEEQVAGIERRLAAKFG
ncbi:hypothetical protein FXF51_01945 [Nonomuraea sp. PA05]|uniref:hypothetical protein n=1 Tax=Nonomuraea sp. PA05 TaxID=2604466 RepID=UPI0011D6EA44|nr:hypothetical protein [Nonomuraea sp. PA05]TYB71223.1 hypothetical protein FXF51_01945 [Nonomuraea sp. PA05]